MSGTVRIVVAGGSGFLGRALVHAWRNDGHEVKVLTRRPGPAAADDVRWDPGSREGTWTRDLEHTDAVVNLAGEGIADKPWTAARKAAILASRVDSTRALAEAIRGCSYPPRVFISASGVGFYGTPGDPPLTEESAPGSDFLATVCQSWERETDAAAGLARIVLLRTGVVHSALGPPEQCTSSPLAASIASRTCSASSRRSGMCQSSRFSGSIS